jgi:hypothetical protein
MTTHSDAELLGVDVNNLTVLELKSLLAERIELPATQQRKSVYVDMLIELRDTLRRRTPEKRRFVADGSPRLSRSASPSRLANRSPSPTGGAVATTSVRVPTIVDIALNFLLFLIVLIPVVYLGG